MPLFLLIVGALLALLGLGSIAAGAPDWLLGLSLGATLIQSGAIALVGGLILVGLGMVLDVLQDLLRRFDVVAHGAPARPAIMPPEEQRPARAASAARSAPPGEPPPRARERDPASDLADELARSAREAPAEPPRARRERREAPLEMEDAEFSSREIPLEPERPRRERREARPEEIARPRRPAPPPPAEEAERPRRAAPPPFADEEPRSRTRPLDAPHEEIPRSRGERPREQADEPRRREFTPIPTIPQPFGSGEGRRTPEPARDPGQSGALKFRPAESAASPPGTAKSGSETVVRSGVIGGMAYTLYVDGSIEAELPIGTVRFNSIAELQDHVMRTGTEADADFDEQNR